PWRCLPPAPPMSRGRSPRPSARARARRSRASRWTAPPRCGSRISRASSRWRRTSSAGRKSVRHLSIPSIRDGASRRRPHAVRGLLLPLPRDLSSGNATLPVLRRHALRSWRPRGGGSTGRIGCAAADPGPRRRGGRADLGGASLRRPRDLGDRGSRRGDLEPLLPGTGLMGELTPRPAPLRLSGEIGTRAGAPRRRSRRGLGQTRRAPPPPEGLPPRLEVSHDRLYALLPAHTPLEDHALARVFGVSSLSLVERHEITALP